MQISDCSVILSSSTYAAKYVRKEGAKHVCYCHTPFRFLWLTRSYLGGLGSNLKTALSLPLLPFLRRWDFSAAQRVSKFIANATQTKERITRFYGRDSVIVPPPIDLSKFKMSRRRGDYFLIVSRLEPYKKLDIAVKAFNELGLPLKIVGDGSLMHRLRKMAHDNVEVLGAVTDSALKELYQGSIALILPQEEDFGLVPIEANAFGKPVICYGSGGVKDTMIPHRGGNSHEATALFWEEQTVSSLKHAMLRFDKLEFNTEALRANAARFDQSVFKKRIREIVEVE